MTRATTVSGLSSAEKKQQDEQDQLIRQLQAKLAAAEKKNRLQKEIVGVLKVAKLLQTANEKNVLPLLLKVLLLPLKPHRK
jgi:hypothetical protein